MATITINQDMKLSSNTYNDINSFMDDFIANNYQNSNIENEYEIASNMKKSGLPDIFIKNFIKSYE